jgi:cell division transport system permease protein
MSSEKKVAKLKVNIGLFDRLRRSPYQSVVAILTMALTLFITGLVTMTALGATLVLRHFESKPQVTAFYKTTVTPTESDVGAVESAVRQTGKVAEFHYISKDQALQLYQQLFKDDPILLELVTAKMLPASIEVATIDPKYLAEISQMLKKVDGIDQVVYQEEVVTNLTRWTGALRQIGVVMIAVFITQALLVVFVIVSLKVALKKEEVEIISLIGGSPWYVYRPFLIDSLAYGAGGAGIAWLGNILVLLYSTPFLVWFLNGVPIFPIPWTFYGALLALQLVLGISISITGSLVALRRFLPR